MTQSPWYVVSSEVCISTLLWSCKAKVQWYVQIMLSKAFTSSVCSSKRDIIYIRQQTWRDIHVSGTHPKRACNQCMVCVKSNADYSHYIEMVDEVSPRPPWLLTWSCMRFAHLKEMCTHIPVEETIYTKLITQLWLPWGILQAVCLLESSMSQSSSIVRYPPTSVQTTLIVNLCVRSNCGNLVKLTKIKLVG